MERFADVAFVLPALILAFLMGQATARRRFRAARSAWETEQALVNRRLADLRGRERASGQKIDQLQRTLLEIPEIAERLISTESLKEVPERALDLAVELFDPSYAVFYRLGRRGLVAVATRGPSEYEVGHRLAVGEGVVGWTAVRQVALTSEDAEAATEAADEAPTPRLIANPIAAPEGLTASQVSVFEAAANTIYRWRTVRSVARQVRLPQGSVQGDLDRLVEQGHIQKRAPETNGVIVYGAVARVA